MTGRRTLLWMIPLDLLLIVWVWCGRIVFGVGGWFLLILLVSVVPLLLVGLLVTTILALTQPGRPRHLTTAQARAQWAVWVALFGAGLLCPDFGDTEDSATSVLTRLFGYSDGLYNLSFILTLAFGGLAVAAWIALIVTLTAGRRTA